MIKTEALVLFIVLAVSMTGADTGEWNVYTYPYSPMENPVACGRPEPSFVCDPNHILPEQDGKNFK